MTDKQKYLALGAVAAVALGYYWYTQHQTAAAAIVSQPTVPKSSLPVTVPVATGMATIPPVGTSSTSSGQDVTELNALLTWSLKTQNPTLYQEMINALTPSQLDSLYGILTTEWTTGAAPTTAQTTFWNQLRQKYPFLNSGGKGCNNLQCN